MFIVGLVKWWYTNGWIDCAHDLKDRLESTMDYFSVGLLLRTMFSLFRQDGAGSVQGTIGVKIHTFFGRLISRILGACIRSTVLIIGCLVLLMQVVASVVIIIGWAIVPVLPIAGFIMSLTGWVPTWR